MSTPRSNKMSSLFVALSVPVTLAISILFYIYVLGDPANFEGGDPVNGHPVAENPAHTFGLIHKGGFVVPTIITVILLVIVYSIERWITLRKATGKGRVDEFLHNVRDLLAQDRVDEALVACDEQRGSVANVMRSGLVKYQTVVADPTLNKETKINVVKQEIDEATSLELPMLSKNLVVLSTCAQVSTLLGLVGTVLGMIRAFSAMATAGAPDATQLSTGISEALINTALGVGGAAFGIIMFNYFTNKVDGITHGIDEAGFSVGKTMASRDI